jgi:hypothetical protein
MKWVSTISPVEAGNLAICYHLRWAVGMSRFAGPVASVPPGATARAAEMFRSVVLKRSLTWRESIPDWMAKNSIAFWDDSPEMRYNPAYG